MLNTFIDFKNTVVNRFGPFLGYTILGLGVIIGLSILGFLVKTFFKILIGLVVAGLVIFGVYKLSELIKSKSTKN